MKNKTEGFKMDTQSKQAQLAEKIIEAKSYEKTSGKYCYVVYSVPMQSYLTTSRMPIMGEWYDADGVRHA
jgi:hypothetical protein